MGFKRMFDCVEVHEGEPMRVITGGVPYIPGDTLQEQEKYLQAHDRQILGMLLNEPRGMPATVISLIVPPKDPQAAAATLFACGDAWTLHSGATVIATATALLETGMIPMQEPVTEFNLEIPAGLVPIRAECKNGKVTRCTFTSLPTFAAGLDQIVDVPSLGKVTIDVAWGGQGFFAVIDAVQFDGLVLDSEHAREIRRLSAAVTQAAKEQLHPVHPDYPDLGVGVSIMYQPPITPGTDIRTANVYGCTGVDLKRPETWETGGLDRGVCGTGSCALMAVLHAKGRLEVGQSLVNEGLMGIQFTETIIGETKVGNYPAILPQLTGECWVYGHTKWVMDETDPFQKGFRFGDIW